MWNDAEHIIVPDFSNNSEEESCYTYIASQ